MSVSLAAERTFHATDATIGGEKAEDLKVKFVRFGS
jgi:hypothetical protein